ncbi:MAG: TetR/AcrR family transcriptional regulator, partial [Baekduiaceae bacterium]
MSDVLETPTGTRDRLLAAALEITREGGYGAASVVAIADRAGVAAGTLYRHFPSKGELFAELFRTVCSGEVEAMRAADPGPSATATAPA